MPDRPPVLAVQPKLVTEPITAPPVIPPINHSNVQPQQFVSPLVENPEKVLAGARLPVVSSDNPTETTWERCQRQLEPCVPWCVGLWLLGVLLLSLRLLLGWRWVQRLKRTSTVPAPAALVQRMQALAKQMRVSRPVKLVESLLIEVPTVLGWLRPIILLPTSALTGLSTEQLEAILAHELANS